MFFYSLLGFRAQIYGFEVDRQVREGIRLISSQQFVTENRTARGCLKAFNLICMGFRLETCTGH